MRKITRTTLVLALCLGQPALAQDYLFSQAGFSGGGVLSGGFSGGDSDGNGVLDYSFDSITAFSLNFSGDSLVPDFSLGLGDLAGLVYNLGGGFIGDDGAVGTGEGLAAFNGDLLSTGFLYTSGIGAAGVMGGTITDFASGAGTTSGQLVSISAVPEPRTWAMLLAGLGLTLLAARRRD